MRGVEGCGGGEEGMKPRGRWPLVRPCSTVNL